MGQTVVCQDSDGEGLGDVVGLEIARGDCAGDDYYWLLHEETAFSMCKVSFMDNDEATNL